MLRPRPRTLLLLGLAAWILFSASWLTLRWRAVRILDGPGITCTWFIPSWARSLDQRWSTLLPMAHVEELSVNRDVTNGADLAWAVRRCGLKGVLDLTGGPSDNPPESFAVREAYAGLRALGRQPAVTTLYITNSLLSEDEITRLLEQFPGLKELQLMHVPYSGKDIPALPALEVADFYNTHFSDEGLRALLQRCPEVRDLDFTRSDITPAAIREIPQRHTKPLERFIFFTDVSKLSEAESEDLHLLLLQAWPALQAKFLVEMKDDAHVQPEKPTAAPPAQ